MVKLPFITRNPNKVMEANAVLSRYGIELVPADLKKVELQSNRLEKIAAFAAKLAYRKLRKPVVVEDSGLFIDALSGFPGPYSSYVYKTIGLHGVLKLMEGVENRSARFKAVVALAYRGGVEIFTGVVHGRIAHEARGSAGFGFDPIFIPQGFSRTFAELGPGVKNKVSHRAKAFEKLGQWLQHNIDKLIPEL